jgi:hypothetical protein
MKKRQNYFPIKHLLASTCHAKITIYVINWRVIKIGKNSKNINEKKVSLRFLELLILALGFIVTGKISSPYHVHFNYIDFDCCYERFSETNSYQNYEINHGEHDGDVIFDSTDQVFSPTCISPTITFIDLKFTDHHFAD